MDEIYTRNGYKKNMATGEYGCGSCFDRRRLVRCNHRIGIRGRDMTLVSTYVLGRKYAFKGSHVRILTPQCSLTTTRFGYSTCEGRSSMRWHVGRLAPTCSLTNLSFTFKLADGWCRVCSPVSLTSGECMSVQKGKHSERKEAELRFARRQGVLGGHGHVSGLRRSQGNCNTPVY